MGSCDSIAFLVVEEMAVSFVWGVDMAVAHLAFGFADRDSAMVDVESLYTGAAREIMEGERLGLLDRQVRICVRQMAGRFPPYVVFVEQPSGRYRNLQLVYATGVVQAAISEVLRCPVWTVPSGKWKKWTIGVGNATKDQVASWAAREGYIFRDQDQCDAMCVAVAGRRMLDAQAWDVDVT